MSILNKRIDLTTGSTGHHLIRMTIPMVWGILAMVSFQLVDAYYISRLGTTQLAAISFTFPVTYGIFSIFIGFSIAMSSVLSRLIGQNDLENVRRIASHGLILVFLASLIIAAFGVPLLDPLFRSMGADDTTLPMIKDFMVPYFIGTFFVSMPVVGNAALRAAGDSVLPAVVMTIAAVVNAAINPILIFGLFGCPRLELFGAALGTIFANICALLAGLYIMHKKGLIDLPHLKNFTQFGDSAKRILMIALPAGLTSMLPSFQGSVITAELSSHGEGAVAAFGAAMRVEAFLMVILMALSIGMAPIIGQNWGAGHLDRVKQTVRQAITFSVAWSAFSGLVLFLLRDGIAQLFSSDAAVVANLTLYFMIVPLSYLLGNIIHGWSSVFNAIGRPQISAAALFVKTIVIGVPAVILGNMMGGAQGVFIALAGVNIVAGLGFHLWARAALGAQSAA